MFSLHIYILVEIINASTYTNNFLYFLSHLTSYFPFTFKGNIERCSYYIVIVFYFENHILALLIFPTTPAAKRYISK